MRDPITAQSLTRRQLEIERRKFMRRREENPQKSLGRRLLVEAGWGASRTRLESTAKALFPHARFRERIRLVEIAEEIQCAEGARRLKLEELERRPRPPERDPDARRPPFKLPKARPRTTK